MAPKEPWFNWTYRDRAASPSTLLARTFDTRKADQRAKTGGSVLAPLVGMTRRCWSLQLSENLREVGTPARDELPSDRLDEPRNRCRPGRYQNTSGLIEPGPSTNHWLPISIIPATEAVMRSSVTSV